MQLERSAHKNQTSCISKKSYSQSIQFHKSSQTIPTTTQYHYRFNIRYSNVHRNFFTQKKHRSLKKDIKIRNFLKDKCIRWGLINKDGLVNISKIDKWGHGEEGVCNYSRKILFPDVNFICFLRFTKKVSSLHWLSPPLVILTFMLSLFSTFSDPIIKAGKISIFYLAMIYLFCSMQCLLSQISLK